MDYGDFRRLDPFSRNFGSERGISVDRHYIGKFVSDNRTDIKGHVLEFLAATYSILLWSNEIKKIDVLNLDALYTSTIVGDLTKGLPEVKSDTFDCIIATQVVQETVEVERAVETLHRILRPGGVLLATGNGIAQITAGERGASWRGEKWRFSKGSCERLFGKFFNAVSVQSYGNVFSATCFLWGIPVQELSEKELTHVDLDYEVVVGVRAVK